jgi:phage baseplate assembly protein W
MTKIRRFGIKYPFTRESGEKTYIDVNKSQDDMIKSRVLHTVLTPKGQRIRMPEFGTNLINFIFDPNDDLTINNIRDEITTSISKYVPEVIFKDITITQPNDIEHSVVVIIEYDIQKGNETITTQVAVKL